MAHVGMRAHGVTEASRFRDFVLTRFQEIHGRRTSSVNPQDDADWQVSVVVEIEPNPNLTLSQRESVIDDFGMQDGKLTKTIRRALVSYFVRHLRIDESRSLSQSCGPIAINLKRWNDAAKQKLEGEPHV